MTLPCSEGFAGDGFRCEQQGCDVMRNCDSNAQCLFDGRTSEHRCVCNQGFKGQCESWVRVVQHSDFVMRRGQKDTRGTPTPKFSHLYRNA